MQLQLKRIILFCRDVIALADFYKKNFDLEYIGKIDAVQKLIKEFFSLRTKLFPFLDTILVHVHPGNG